MQEKLRKEAKFLKAIYDAEYKLMSEYIGMSNVNSFYNWLHGYYNLSEEKQELLKEYFEIVKGE